MYTIKMAFRDSKLGGQNCCNRDVHFSLILYLLSIRKHHQCSMWVQWHILYLFNVAGQNAQCMQINYEWRCYGTAPSKSHLFEVSSFCYWNRLMKMFSLEKMKYFMKGSNSLKTYWIGTRQVILKTFKTFAEHCCAGSAKGQAVPHHNVKKTP